MLTRYTLIAALLVSAPAAADERVCTFGNPGTTISIHEHEQAAAEVRIWNALAFRRRGSPCVVTLGDMSVEVVYNAGPGREPDVFITTPSPGYFAAPDWLLLDDETEASVLIWPLGEGAGS